MILSITGPSGVGKTTLLHNLLHALPNAQPLRSYTTRAARVSDEPGEYVYISTEGFDILAHNGAFLWEARTYVNRYGTKKEDVDHALEGGVYLPVLVIDAVKTLHMYAKEADKESAVRSIYVYLDDEQELYRRLKERGDREEEIQVRIAECRLWNKEARASGIPFIYLAATQRKEEISADALRVIHTDD